MRKNNTKAGLIMVVVVALFGSLSAYQYYIRKQHHEEIKEETLDSAVPRVSVVHPGPGPEKEDLTLPGTVEAWYQAPIYAQVSGYVSMWHKDYGALVKEGDLLAEINTPALDAEYAKAKAELKSAEAEYKLAVVTAKRWEAMRASQAVSEQAISEKQANERSMSAKVESARQHVARYEALQKFKKIVAPFDGVVTSRSINVGDYVSEGGGNMGSRGDATELFSVADTHAMRIFVSVPGVFAYILKPGLTADVVVPQYADRHFEAKFLTVAKGFDMETRTTVTEFTIDNEDGALWPGSYATVNMTAPSDSKILTIPTSALVFQEKGLQVATVDENSRVHFKNVTSGKILGEIVQITLGVKEDDRIIDNPQAALMENEEVIVVPPTPGYNAPAGSGIQGSTHTEPASGEHEEP